MLFRLVDAVPLLSVLRSARAANLHVPPTHRGCCPCHSVRRLPSSIHRLRRIAPRLLRRLPRPRCAVRRCPDATPADGQPLLSTSSGLRLTARRGRLTLKPQAFRDSLSVDCVNRHPSALFTPSRQRSFGCLTSVSRNIVITTHRHIQSLDLIGVSASRESGAVVCVEIRERNFHAHGSDLTFVRCWLHSA